MENPENKPDPNDDPLKLPEVRVPDPLPPSEREVLEGRIKEVLDENAALKSEIEKLKAPAPKKKSGLSRFSPL